MTTGARIGLLLVLVVPTLAFAQATAEETELEERLQNPITDLMLVQLLSTVDLGLGRAEENRTLVSVQAQVPIRVINGWNVLAWTQLPIQSLPPAGAATDRINGIGDTTQYLLASPSRVWRFHWQVGAVGLLPTATRTALGAGMLAVGPAGFVTFQDGRWTVGLLAHHLISVDGVEGAREVRRTFLKPVLSYTFSTGANLGLESETTIDWGQRAADRWLVPVQLGVSRVTVIGNLPLNIQLGVRWYAVSPLAGPDFGVRLAISFVIPIHREEGAEHEEKEPGTARH